MRLAASVFVLLVSSCAVVMSQDCSAVVWTQADLSAVDPLCFASLTSDQLTTVVACDSLTATQVSHIESESPSPLQTCSGLAPACAKKLKVAAAGALTVQCVSHLTKITAAALSEAQLGAISPEAFAGFSGENFGDVEKCGMLDRSRVGKLAPGACGVMTPECMISAPADDFAVTRECAAKLPQAVLEEMDDNHLSGMGDAIAGLQDGEYFAELGRACGGILAEQMKLLTSACAVMSEGCARFLSPGALGEMTLDCAKQLKDSSVKAIATEENLGFITPESFAGLGKNNFGTTEDCSTILLDQAQMINPEACGVMTVACVESFPAENFGLPRNCVENLPDLVVSALDADHIEGLGDVVAALDSRFELLGEGCGGLNDDQMQNLTLACGLFNKECVENLPITAIRGLTDACVVNLKPATITAFASDQVAALPDYFWQEPTAELFAALANCSDIGPSELASLTNHCDSLSITCLSSMDFRRFGDALQPVCVNAIEPQTMASLNVSYAASLNPQVLVSLPMPTWLALLKTHQDSLVSALTEDRLVWFPITGVQIFSEEIAKEPAMAFYTLCPPTGQLTWLKVATARDDQVACLNASHFRTIKSRAAIRQTQVPHLTSQVLATVLPDLAVDAVHSITAEQVTKLGAGEGFSSLVSRLEDLDSAAFAGITKEQVLAFQGVSAWPCRAVSSLKKDVRKEFMCSDANSYTAYYHDNCKVSPCKSDPAILIVVLVGIAVLLLIVAATAVLIATRWKAIRYQGARKDVGYTPMKE